MSYSSWACKELDMTETTEHAHRVITVGGLFSLHFGFLVLFYFFFFLNNCICFGCSGSSELHGLFSSSGEWGLLCSCGLQASHGGGFPCCKFQ